MSTILLLLLAVPPPLPPGEEGGLPAAEMIDGYAVRAVLPKDAIQAIDHPEIAPARGGHGLQDTDAVLGVVLGGKARAYSLARLDWHEVVNDRLGGRPIAVTW